MNCTVYYKYDKSLCEDVVNTPLVSKINTYTHPGGTNTRYISYADATRSNIK